MMARPDKTVIPSKVEGSRGRSSDFPRGPSTPLHLARDAESNESQSGLLFRLLERVNDKAHDRDADAGIGDVKRGPRAKNRQRYVQVEEEEIDDVSVEETIGEVSHYAGQEESQ